MRPPLTYSNVVATLALFVALGGTGSAAAKITSSDIENRTIKGGDVRKDALGGTEIREARLGTVPSSALAATASLSSGGDFTIAAGDLDISLTPIAA
jgi:hypothetical protein